METAPLSLDLRMEKKRRRTKVGIACIVAGVILLAIGGFGLLRGGADILGVWGLVMGVALVGTGGYTLRRAATSRW
jgi:drug/metabolite transporter (DMT)-like permease